MTSYAVIDRFEGNFAVCEVELVEMEKSNSEDYFFHKTTIIDVPTCIIGKDIGTIGVWDILVVEHDGATVSKVYCRSREEEARRVRAFNVFMSK